MTEKGNAMQFKQQNRQVKAGKGYSRRDHKQSTSTALALGSSFYLSFFFIYVCCCCRPIIDFCRVNAGFHKKKICKPIILKRLRGETEIDSKACEKYIFSTLSSASAHSKSHNNNNNNERNSIYVCYRLFLHKEKRLQRILIFTLSIVGDFSGTRSPATGFNRSGTWRAGTLKNTWPHGGSCLGRFSDCGQLTFKEFVQWFQRAGTEAGSCERGQAGGAIEHRWSGTWHAAIAIPVDWRRHIGFAASACGATGAERRGRATGCKRDREEDIELKQE